jgi:HSP20 family protein
MAQLLSRNVNYAREDLPITFGRSLRRSAAGTGGEKTDSSRRSVIGELRANLHDAVNRWLHGLKRRSLTKTEHQQPPFFFGNGDPSIDVQETEDEIVVRAEMPGMEPGDFKVEATDDRLILRGQKKVENEEQGRDHYFAERRFGAFTRIIPLPSQVDVRRATATYKNGLLRIVLPKADDAKARSARVQVT